MNGSVPCHFGAYQEQIDELGGRKGKRKRGRGKGRMEGGGPRETLTLVERKGGRGEGREEGWRRVEGSPEPNPSREREGGESEERGRSRETLKPNPSGVGEREMGDTYQFRRVSSVDPGGSFSRTPS